MKTLLKLSGGSPRAWFKAAAVLCAALCSTASLAQSYLVTVDTSALGGASGYLDFQLNPADLSAPTAVANIADLLGSISVLGTPVIEGNVTGALPGAITLTNSSPFNDYFQSVQFGNAFGFSLNFSGDFLAQLGNGTSFSLSLYAADGVTPLLTTDTSGSVLRFELLASGLTYETFPATVGGTSIVQVAPVPLPAAGWLLLSGLVGLVRVARRRSAA